MSNKFIHTWSSHTEKKIIYIFSYKCIILSFTFAQNFYLLCSIYWCDMQYAQIASTMIEWKLLLRYGLNFSIPLLKNSDFLLENLKKNITNNFYSKLAFCITSKLFLYRTIIIYAQKKSICCLKMYAHKKDNQYSTKIFI